MHLQKCYTDGRYNCVDGHISFTSNQLDIHSLQLPISEIHQGTPETQGQRTHPGSPDLVPLLWKPVAHWQGVNDIINERCHVIGFYNAPIWRKEGERIFCIFLKFLFGLSCYLSLTQALQSRSYSFAFLRLPSVPGTPHSSPYSLPQPLPQLFFWVFFPLPRLEFQFIPAPRDPCISSFPPKHH